MGIIAIQGINHLTASYTSTNEGELPLSTASTFYGLYGNRRRRGGKTGTVNQWRCPLVSSAAHTCPVGSHDFVLLTRSSSAAPSQTRRTVAIYALAHSLTSVFVCAWRRTLPALSLAPGCKHFSPLLTSQRSRTAATTAAPRQN